MGPMGRIMKDIMFRRSSPGSRTIPDGRLTTTVFSSVCHIASPEAKSGIYDCLVQNCMILSKIVCICCGCHLCHYQTQHDIWLSEACICHSS